ncbi:hypothetical protein EYZ11_003941 [Aspergillus tanneri]|uniref:Uncharacterized protein n=1 Tax=Aspergillus tanneri TaxID=1220188 RepID=A0A4S3JSP7_9EURO|nr:hypothetical protein EYZ11_003941 [Aspergillus tanneri]
MGLIQMLLDKGATSDDEDDVIPFSDIDYEDNTDYDDDDDYDDDNLNDDDDDDITSSRCNRF